MTRGYQQPSTAGSSRLPSSDMSLYGFATLSPFQLRLYFLKRLARIFSR